MSERPGHVEDHRLERRYRELCDFVSIVAHDLRTPLTSIRGYAQLLRRQAGAETPVAMRSGLDTIMLQADRLAEYTEWLLEIARLQTGRVALARTGVDFESLVREEVAALGTPVTFSSGRNGSPIVVDADVRRVRQMVRAMVEFAAQRTPTMSPVSVAPAPTVYMDVADGHGRLVVEDQGLALGAAERADLLQRLVLTSDDGRQRSLARVGLVIAAGMAAAHGGRLDVKSPVLGSDRGVRLSLYLPQSR